MENKKNTTQCLLKEEEVKQKSRELLYPIDQASKSTFVSNKENLLRENQESERSFIGFEQEGNLISSINNDESFY